MKQILIVVALGGFLIAGGCGKNKPPLVFQKQAEGPAEGSSLSSITAIKRSNDGRVLVTVVDNTRLRFWEAATGKSLRDLESRDTEWLFAPAFSSDATAFASADSETSAIRKQYGRLQFWNPDTGERIGVVEGINWPNCVKFNSSGTLVAVGAINDLYLVDVGTRTVTGKVQNAHTNGAIMALDLSAGGELLATAGRDGLVKLWQMPDLKPVRSFSIGQTVRGKRAVDGPHTVVANSVAFSHDHTLLAAGTEEGSVYFWEVETGKEGRKYLADKPLPDRSFPEGLKNALTFTADDNWVLTTTPNGQGIRMLNALEQKEYQTEITTGTGARIVAMDGSTSDGSVAIAYRDYHPGAPIARFAIWSPVSAPN